MTKRTKDRPGKPAWRPRSSGSRIDKTSDQYKADLRNAERGIPHFGVLKWLEVQAFDNGASDKPGHVRWKLKLSFTAADVALLSRQGKRDVSRTRFAPLSTPAAFKRNLRRRKGRWKPTTECLAVAHELCAMVEGKDALLGQVSMRFGGEGTIAYPGQFALLVWDADTGWPNVVICQYLGDGTGAWHGLTVELRPPSTTNRDGTSRRGGSAFVGTWVSAALQRRIDDAKAVLVSASVK